jgi:hypothetical protein
LAKRLKASQYRLLSVVAIDRGKEREPSDEPLPLDQFRATFYDYTNEMAIVCEGRLDALARILTKGYHHAEPEVPTAWAQRSACRFRHTRYIKNHA